MVREITLAKLNLQDELADKSFELIQTWKRKVLSSDSPTKKKDLYELDLLLKMIDASTEAITYLAQEIKAKQQTIQHKEAYIRKCERYIKAKGGDPSLIGWQRDHDFV